VTVPALRRLALLAALVAAAGAAGAAAGVMAAGPAIAQPAMEAPPDYRDALRGIVSTLAQYAKGRDATFQVLTREGLGLVIKSERDAALERLTDPAAAEEARAVAPTGYPVRRYVRHLDGVVMNDQYCVATKAARTASDAFIAMLQESGLTVLSVDHCPDSRSAIAGWTAARRQSVVAHVDTLTGEAAMNGLQRVPGGRPPGENPDNITRLSQARNLLLLDGSSGYADKASLVLDLASTNYDILALSPFHRHGDPLTAAQVKALTYKALGARRLVLARIDVTQAWDTAYYWKDSWRLGDPAWLRAPDPRHPGAYDVDFWDGDWRAILGQTFAGIMDLGFDGVILEGVDAYGPLEAKEPLQ
jgi:hypothetical protein